MKRLSPYCGAGFPACRADWKVRATKAGFLACLRGLESPRHSVVIAAVLTAGLGVFAGAEAAEPGGGSMPGGPAREAPGEAMPVELGDREVVILSPEPGTALDLPAATVVLQFPLGCDPELWVNGTPVDPALLGQTETDERFNRITQTWYGVPLRGGENVITARATAAGVSGPVASVKVAVRGAPRQLLLGVSQPRLPADGRSTVTVFGKLLDENGNVSNRDARVTLLATGGEWVGADEDQDQPGFQVQAVHGQFAAVLRSGLQAQPVRLRAFTGDLRAFTQVEFATDLRPGIVTGLLDVRLGRRSTDFYRGFRDFLRFDRDGDRPLSYYSAGFATGKLGSWLFTGAYNTDRPLNQDRSGRTGLHRDLQEDERVYPTYGDGSTTERLAQSQDKMYLRLERDRDYLMWGDYSTGEFAQRSQQFSAVTRQLHAFKGNYHLGALQVTGFYGDNVQGFQRDTIAPDGTGGYYFLSRRPLVIGSENVFIELEELNRPGTVIERAPQVRGLDYEIDYDRGALLFRRPILRTEVDLFGRVLVRRIVVTYQFESRGEGASVMGSRVQYHLSRKPDRESWLGATYLRESQGVRDFDLYGADTLISLDRNTGLIAEYAHSRNRSELLGSVSGSAYHLEVVRTPRGPGAQGLRGRIYLHAADSGFSNNATVSFVPGQTRYGAQVAAPILPRTNLRFQYDHEENRGIAPQVLDSFRDLLQPGLTPVPGSRLDNRLDTLSFGIEHRLRNIFASVDLVRRSREDRVSPGLLDGDSTQIQSRLTAPLSKRLTFLAQDQRSISEDTDPVLPDRSVVGLDYALRPGINLRLAQTFFNGGKFEDRSITSLDTVADYKLSPATTLLGRASLLGRQSGLGFQGSAGVNHRWVVARGLRLNLSYERVFGDFFDRTGAGRQFPQPYAPGSGAATVGVSGGESYGVGFDYNPEPRLKVAARFERRRSSEGTNTVIGGDLAGKLSSAWTALAHFHQADFANQLLSGLGSSSILRTGLAYRHPRTDRFNMLLRYEYRKNPAIIPGSQLVGAGTGGRDHTLAVETIYAPDWRWEFYGKCALRDSTLRLARHFSGGSLILLSQLRATYRLGYRVDLVGEARWLDQPAAGYGSAAFFLEAGYFFTPNLRVAAGYGFGRSGNRDFDGGRSKSGPYMGVTVKVNELFRGFGLQKPVPAQKDLTTEITRNRGYPRHGEAHGEE
jgi:hypothetical protein